MIYALFDFTQERWLLLGDYDNELELVEYLNALVGSPCFKSDTLAAYRIADFGSDTGCIGSVPRVRVWDYYPANVEGVSCRGANCPPEEVLAPQEQSTLCPDKHVCQVEKCGFFSRFNPFKSKKGK